MNPAQRAALFVKANEIGSSSRRGGAPKLDASSSREAICDWLQWCDPNGCHTDRLARANDFEPYTYETALEALEELIEDD